MGPEKRVERKIVKYLESQNAFVHKFHGGSPGVRKGIPDLLAIYRGIAIFIEVKREQGGRILPIQVAQIDALRQHGTIAIVSNDLDIVKDLVATIDEMITQGSWQNIQSTINTINQMGVKH